MPDWSDLPVLSATVAQRSDQAGNSLSSGGIEDASNNIDPRISEFILYGVFNGSFARGPRDESENIDDQNPLPDWTGPTQVSGGAITCQWVADASSPSGYNLRFSIAPGAAGDEAYVEQIVPIGGERRSVAAHYIHATGFRATATGGAPLLVTACQYLTASGATTGTANESTTTLSADGVLRNTNTYGTASGTGFPADALFLRIRVGVRRNTMAASDTAVVDVSDVRTDRGGQTVVITDVGSPATYAPGEIYQSGGFLFLSPANASGNGAAVRQTAGPFQIIEQTAPGTPSSGYYSIYPKTDGILYGLNDSGTEVAFTGGGGGITIQNTISPSISANQNNYAPTGWQTATAIFINVNSGVRTITGIDATGFVEGQSFWLSGNGNPGGNAITIANTSASSTSGNRFGCPGGVDYTIGNNGGVYVIYSPATNSTSPFRVMGKS